MVINYREVQDKEHLQAEKNIDRDTNNRFCFLRSTIVQEGMLSEEELNLFINSLLSDPACLQATTDGYDMHNIDDEEVIFDFENKKRPLYWLKQQAGNAEMIKSINNIKKRFLEKKSSRSYNKPSDFKNPDKYEKSYAASVKEFDTRDVALNDIIEFAISDLIDDILQDKLAGKYHSIEVFKTNEYDDVMGKTDFIIRIQETPNKPKKVGAFDLTLSGNERNLERKRNLKSVFCPHFNFKERITTALPRSLIVLKDKSMILKYVQKYMQYVMRTGEMPAGKSNEIFSQSFDQHKNVKANIIEQLTDNFNSN